MPFEILHTRYRLNKTNDPAKSAKGAKNEKRIVLGAFASFRDKRIGKLSFKEVV